MDHSAWNTALQHSGLVHSILKKEFSWILSKSSVLDYDDLYQVGMLAVYKAVLHYDKNKGFAFSSFACRCIKQNIRRTYNNEGFFAVKIPEPKFNEIGKLIKKNKQEIDFDNMHENGEITKTTYEAAKASTVAPIYFDALRYEPNFSATKTEEVYSKFQDGDLRNVVLKHLDSLTDRERYVVERRFGLCGRDEWTFDELGDVLNVSKERVRQIQANAIDQMRDEFERKTVKFEDLI